LVEKLPLTRNIRWFQLAYGAFIALVGYRSYLAYSGQQPLGAGAQAGLFLAFGASIIVFLVYLQNVHRYGLVPDYSLKCRFCNGPVNRYSEFCEHCGADLIAEEKLVLCPKCGVELMEGTRFCPECGARLVQPNKKKGKKKQPPQEGWDAPIDATTGVPPARTSEDDEP